MPSWRPNCLRGSIYNEPPQHYSITPQTPQSWQPGQEICEDKKGTLVVELQKKEGCGLGLTVSGGIDKSQRPHVSNLRPGSIAHRCDALLVGDHIVSVNGIRTANFRHEEIVNLLKNAGINVTLEIEYEIPEAGFSGVGSLSHVHEVTLDKEVSGFGLTLRGGLVVDKMRAHPLVVVAVRHGGPADREGSIRVGDRVIAINGYKVTHLTLTETLSLFTQCDVSALFTIAYDVAAVDTVENASGPLLLEVDRTPGSGLGLSLSQSVCEGRSCLCVDTIQPMSSADRCGALHAGDHILAIDGASVESMSVAEACQLLKSGNEHSVQLEIIPSAHLENCNGRDILARSSLASSFSSHTLPVLSVSTYSNLPYHHNKNNNIGYGSSGSNGDRGNSRFHSFSDNSSVSVGASQFGTLNMRKRNMWIHGPERRATSCMSIASSSTSVLTANNQVCHTETVEVILFADHKGLGITLKGGVFSTTPLLFPPTIASVEPRSAADKCGVLQEGDRVLSINGLETIDRTLEEVNHFLRESRPRCVLLIEFDVAESVMPSSGVYIVKLAKKSGDTGITVGANQSYKNCNDSLYISDVRRGSVAHRTGSIQPGDKLLAINDVRLDTCTSEDAMHLLELPDDIVKLKLHRDDPDEGNEGCIIYTVELQRLGGPLGITISGTEDPQDPIVISELTAHGLAERTGAIHVGDRLLAVSGNPTKNKPLSEAIRMLQSAGDIVTLKIARPDPADESSLLHLCPFTLDHRAKPSTPIPSVDSAMESWDSSGHDLVCPSNNHHDSSGVVAPARPHLAVGDKYTAHNLSNFDQAVRCQSSHKWDGESEDSKEYDSDDKSSQMDDWVKTLEEFDMGSGSEMLRQIGMSLRERSVMSLDRKLQPENIATAMQTRSKSTCRVEALGSNSNNSISEYPITTKQIPSKHFDSSKSAVEVPVTHKAPIQQEEITRSSEAVYTKMSSSSSSSAAAATKSPSCLQRSSSVKSKNKNYCRSSKDQIQTIFTPHPIQLQRVVLEKSFPAEDFGFSISDGLFNRGVYIKAVRSGGLAEKAGLKALDRILQVDKVKIRDFDCRLALPLISGADKRLSLIVCRNPLLPKPVNSKDVTGEKSSVRRKFDVGSSGSSCGGGEVS